MERSSAFLVAALLLAPPASAGEAAKVPWGSDVSKDYTVWTWIGEFTDEDERGWDDLDAERQTAAVSKAVRACGKAHARISATRGQTDGEAILALTDGDLAYAEACFKDGETLSSALQEKRGKLAAIKAKAGKGIYDPADMEWLRAHNITLQHQPPKGKEDAKLAEERAKKQEKAASAAKKKYGKMKDLDEAGLREAYDGGPKKKGASGDSVDLSRVKMKGAPPKPETRDPKKKLTSTAPPDIGGKPKPAPEGTFVWNGKKLTSEQQAKLDKCRAQKCDLYAALSIVDPQKLKAPYDYKKPASRAEIVKMEKDFKALVGRDLTFDDLLKLRDDKHGPATGYEGNNLAALEHKYFVNDQVASGVQRCPDVVGLHGACVLLNKAVLRVAAPAVYEYGKSYMVQEQKAAAGDPMAMTAQVINLPLMPVNLAVKGLVIGSKDGVSMETVKKTLRPADAKSVGSTPSGQNVLCAIGIFCGD